MTRVLRPDRRRTALVLAAWLLAGVALMAVASWITGPQPVLATSGAPHVPPPLVLRDAVAADAPLARASAALVAGDERAAMDVFAGLVAQHPNDVAPQLGMVLARWRLHGAAVVERDIERLAGEYPGDAYVLLHLGLVQIYVGDQADGRATLRQTLRAAQRGSHADVARRADDLLHPVLAPGYPPLLVVPGDCGGNRACTTLVVRLRARLAAGDRAGAARIVASIPTSRTTLPAEVVARALASYDKSRPGVAIAQLRRSHSAAAPVVRLHRALLAVWGRDRDGAMRDLRALAREPATTRWHRQARAIVRRLDAGPAT